MITKKPYRKIINISDVTSEMIDQMFELMEKYYSNMFRDVFVKDLKSKTSLICLFNGETNELIGFSTLKVFDHVINNQKYIILYSGDTIIEKEFWGSQELAIAFGEYMIQLLKNYPENEIYWFLISKGFRTYKYLPAFFKKYYPNEKEPIPKNIFELMNSLAYRLFPEQFDHHLGIIKAVSKGEFLKKDFHPERNYSNSLENFYYQKNPGYDIGNELVCITQLSTENVCDFMKRVLKI